MLLLLLHHLAGDHQALEVMQQEIALLLSGRSEDLPPAQPFRNYVAQARLGVSAVEHEAFFQHMVGSVTEPTLPYGLADVQGDGSEVHEAHHALPQTLSAGLRQQARKLGVSVASLCHLAYAQVLGRVCGRDDVVFGTVLFGRMQGGTGADRALGLYINTLPLRVQLTQGVREAVQRVHQDLAGLLRHEHASLTLAQRCSGLESGAPLVTALLNYRYGQSASAVDASAAAPQGIEQLAGQERTNYPFVLSVDDLGVHGLELSVQVHVPAHPHRVCALMQHTLEQLLSALHSAPQQLLSALPGLSESAQHELEVLEAGATLRSEWEEVLLRVEHQVREHPQAIALVQGARQMSYGELQVQASAIGAWLSAQGIGEEDRVAVCMPRSLEWVVSLLGSWVAGACYVPLDPQWPDERLQQTLVDSAAKAVLVLGSRTRARVARLGAAVVLDVSTPVPVCEQVQSQARSASRLAYVIYTSGSTGEPKGVMVEHRQLSNLVSWHVERFGLGVGHRTSLTGGVGFDASSWELWPALGSGATVVVPPLCAEGEALDAMGLLQWWRVQRLESSFLVTPLAELALAAGELPQGLQVLLTGGERLRCVPERLSVELVNNYGPTETTVVASSGEMRAGQEVLDIGGPIANTRLYVLDEHGRRVPMGAVGELYIGGAGVARGYLNHPELTRERFVADPFVGGEARMYRTGDLVRWREGGVLEYLGRNDLQVKIRGYRIELGEIEAKLLSCAGVKQAVVLTREEGVGNTQLVAYYVSETEQNAQQIREYLSERLPSYMVPSAFVRLDSLPLTANGKLDRKALPAPGGEDHAHRGYEAPQGALEEQLAQLWSEVLQVPQVGRHDNFFELGGHSLLAVSLIERMRQVGIASDVRSLFAQPRLHEFATAIATVEVVL